MREPMEGRQGGGNDRWPNLAAIPGAMPCGPGLRRRRAIGRFRFRAGPSARARLSVRLFVSVAAAVRAGVECWRSLRRPGRRIRNRASGAGAMPVGHGRVDEHIDACLPLLGNPLLRAHPQGRVYVRDPGARRRISRGAGPRARGADALTGGEGALVPHTQASVGSLTARSSRG